MSIETQLREALAAQAGAAVSAEQHPYERVSVAVAKTRTRRRTVGAAVVAVVAAIAIGVPTVASRLGNDALPAGTLPAASDKAWNSVATWPTRGALAGDSTLVAAIGEQFDGRPIFVEDVDTARVAIIVRGDRLIIARGPRGATGKALTELMQWVAPTNREDSLLSVGAGKTLVIITTPDRTSAEVSGTPGIALDGAVTRTWTKLPLASGIGRTALSPLTRFRLDWFSGSVQHPVTQDAQKITLDPCQDGCTGPRATVESQTTADIARTLGLDATQLTTTTLFDGKVPREVTTFGSTPSESGTPSLLVMHSRLPGGQILRTAVLRSADAERSLDLGGPIDARRAAAVPLLISANDNDRTAPTNVRVFVASGTDLRAVSDSNPSVVIPLTGHIANFTLPVSLDEFWATYRFEVLDGGKSLGTFPVTNPLDDPFPADSARAGK